MVTERISPPPEDENDDEVFDEQERAIILISLTLRQMYFPPANRNDRVCLKKLINKFRVKTRIEEVRIDKDDKGKPGKL